MGDVAQQLALLHLAELRGARLFPTYLYVSNQCKPSGMVFEDKVSDRIFDMYRNLLLLGCKILDHLGYPEDPASSPTEVSSDEYNKVVEFTLGQNNFLPTYDAVDTILQSGQAMSFASVYQVLLGPLHLELESTKLWPIPPPLAY